MVCPNCKQETSPALFCHACDAYLPNPAMGVKASVARRFGALLLDSIAIWVVFFIVFLLSAGMAGIGMSAGSNDAGIGAFILTFLGAAVAYPIFALWFLSKGKTPGKWLVGIRAADKSNGSLPGLGRMLVRETIGKFLSGLFFGLGYFWAIFDKDAQCWHDKVAGTVVLRQPVATPVVAPAIVTTPADPAPVALVRQSADATNELSTVTPSHEPGNQVVPRYRHSPIWWVLGGFGVLSVIVLGGLFLAKETLFSPPVQRSIPPQAFAPPQQKALSPAGAKRPRIPADSQTPAPLEPVSAQVSGLAPLETGIVATCSAARGWKDYTPKTEFRPGESVCVYAEALNVNKNGRIDVTFPIQIVGPAGTPLSSPPLRCALNTVDPSCQGHWDNLVLPSELDPGIYAATVEMRNNLTGQTGSSSTNFTVVPNRSNSQESGLPPMDQLVGVWKNGDVSTGGMRSLTVRVVGNQLLVHARIICGQGDCDWGEVPAATISDDGDGATVLYKQTSSKTTMTLSRSGFLLHVEVVTHYTDGRGADSFSNALQFAGAE